MPEDVNDNGNDGDDDDDDTGTGDTEPKVEVKDGKVLIDGVEFDPQRAMETITAQRASEKTLRKELRDAQRAVKAIENKDKPKDQQLASDLADAVERADALEAKLQKNTLRTEALQEAGKLKFRNPAVAYKLIDPDDVDWDDDGRPTNIARLLQRELRDNAYLARRTRTDNGDDDDDKGGGADGGAGRGSGGKATGSGFINDTIREMAGRG